MKNRFFKLAVSALFLLSLCGCTKVSTDINKYKDQVNKFEAGSFMPDLSSSDKIKSTYQKRTYGLLFYQTDTLLLVNSYDNHTDYEVDKNNAESTLKFSTSITVSDIGSFSFHVCESTDFNYPKKFGIIGFSDKESKIAYLWVYDDELDNIENMTDFISQNFDYDFTA